jgi:hypothetical protein
VSGATYRQVFDNAFDAAGRASIAMAKTRFAGPAEAEQAVAAYRDLLAAVASHLEYLVAPNRMGEQSLGAPRFVDPQLAHAADVIRRRAARCSAPERLDGVHPVAGSWWQAATAVRAAQELLDTHRGPELSWRTPDAWLLDHPQAQAAAVGELGDFIRAIAGSSTALALRGREVLPRNRELADLVEQLPLRLAGAEMRDYARRAGGLRGIDDLRVACFSSGSATPLGSAIHAMTWLRQRAYEHTAHPQVSVLTLRAYAAAAVTVHQHAAAITAAAEIRCPQLAPEKFLGAEAADYRLASTASRRAAQSWIQVHRELAGMHSLTPPEPGTRDQVLAMSAELRALTRSDTDWLSAEAMLPDRGSADALLKDVHQLISSTPDIAAWHGQVAGRLAAASRLYVPAISLDRDDVSEDPTLAAARLARRLTPVPPRQVDAVLRAYADAEQTSRQAALAHGYLCAPAAVTLPGPQWRELCSTIDPRVTADAHWPVLAAALDRVAAAGVDVRKALDEIARGRELPEHHPARALHYRLLDVSDAAITTVPAGLAGTPQTTTRRPSPPAQTGQPRSAPSRFR